MKSFFVFGKFLKNQNFVESRNCLVNQKTKQKFLLQLSYRCQISVNVHDNKSIWSSITSVEARKQFVFALRRDSSDKFWHFDLFWIIDTSRFETFGIYVPIAILIPLCQLFWRICRLRSFSSRERRSWGEKWKAFYVQEDARETFFQESRSVWMKKLQFVWVLLSQKLVEDYHSSNVFIVQSFQGLL